MRRIRPGRPSPALVLSIAALFVALSGTAVALKANSVASRHIKEGAVRSEHIKDGRGVKSADLAENAIPADPGSLGGSTKIADDAIGRGELAFSAVGSSEIAAAAVTFSKIAANAVDALQLVTPVLRPGSPTAITDADGGDENWSGGTASTACDFGQELLSAYAEWTDASGGDDTATAEMVLNPPTRNVVVRGIQNTGDTRSLRAVAVCLPGP